MTYLITSIAAQNNSSLNYGHWSRHGFSSSPNMADNSPPCSDEGTPGLTPDNGSVSTESLPNTVGNSPSRSDNGTPELTPDNGSVSSSSLPYSFDNQWDHRWDEEVIIWEANNEPYIPRRINFLREPDESDDEGSPPTPVVGRNRRAQGAAWRLARERLMRLVNPRAQRSAGRVRPSSRSNPGILPARGYWDSPHLLGIPEFQAANHQSEERHFGLEEQGPVPDGEPSSSRAQDTNASHHLMPIDASPAFDLGSPLVSPSELPPYVTPPRGRTSSAQCGPATVQRLEAPVRPSIPSRPAEWHEPADVPRREGAARFRGFWRGMWRRVRCRRHEQPRNGRRGSGGRLFPWRRHET